jgi:hypothetical protein
VPWSLVLKWFRPVGRDDPTWLTYWRREILAYRSGLLEELPGGVAAPRCFGTTELPDGAVGLWLEEIVETQPGRWPLERFALAARHLGQFNGHYLRTGDVPVQPWLGSDYLRRYAADRPQWVEAVGRVLEQPIVGRHWTREMVDATLRLYGERDALFDAHGRLPRTFCHGDTGRRNLLARRRADGADETVLIDWAYCGVGAVGEDLHQTVVTSAHMFDVDVEEIDELERRVLEAYGQGLGDAGAEVDPRLVRLGYLVPAALRNTLMPFGLVMPEPTQRREIERSYGRGFEEWVVRQVAVRRFMLERADHARALVVELTADGAHAPAGV